MSPRTPRKTKVSEETTPETIASAEPVVIGEPTETIVETPAAETSEAAPSAEAAETAVAVLEPETPVEAITETPGEPTELAELPVVPSTAPTPDAGTSPAAPTPATDETLMRRALEGLLFITDRPLSAAELGRLINVRDQDRIVEVVEGLRRELEERNLGYKLVAVAEGWQMATRAELAPYVRKLFADRATMRLSTAAQETLSIIAYKQPLTRAEIEEIRGVEVIAALETLLEKRLVKVVGRRETVGRPLMYGTTLEFLRHFGLRSLEDLPPLSTFGPADAQPAAAAPAADSAAVPTANPSTDAPLLETPAAEESYTRTVPGPLDEIAKDLAETPEIVAEAEAEPETPAADAAGPAAPAAETVTETESAPETGSGDDEASIWPK